jgi:hypothetical protein
MQSFIYSNVGFRCESVCKELNYLKKNKKDINNIILEDSRKILNDCLRIENDERHAIYLSNSNDGEFESILYEYILEKKDKDIISRLKKIVSYLDKIESLKDTQIDELSAFFGSIVDMCRNKIQFNHFDDDFNFPGIF